MFGFFNKRKTFSLYAPVKGCIQDVQATPDSVFSSGMMGDGICINPEGSVITAPCDGEVIVVPKTRHAVALKSTNGVEILIHVGLDTVELGGEGFISHVRQGDQVKLGDKLLTFDASFISSKGKSLVTPVVITNMADKVDRLTKHFDRADGIILEIMAK